MAVKRDCRVSANITAEEREKLEKYCEEHDLTLSQALREAIKIIINSNK